MTVTGTLPAPQEPGPDEDVSDRYDLGYKHGYKDGLEHITNG